MKLPNFNTRIAKRGCSGATRCCTAEQREEKGYQKGRGGRGTEGTKLQIVCVDNTQKEVRTRKAQKRLREMVGNQSRQNEVVLLTMGKEDDGVIVDEKSCERLHNSDIPTMMLPSR